MKASQLPHIQDLLRSLTAARTQLRMAADVPAVPEGLILMVTGTNTVLTLGSDDSQAVRDLVYELLAARAGALDKLLRDMGIEPDE